MSGAVRWETNVRGDATAKYFFHGDVFVTPDRIIASADVDTATGMEAGIHAFDRSSGRQLWKYPTGRGVLGAIVVLDSRVFAYVANGDLIALDLASGTRAWSYPLKASPWESPGVAGQYVFAGSSDGSLYAFDGDTGRVQWQRKLESPIATSIRVGVSAVYAGTANGMMHQLAPNTGDVLASVNVDPVLQPTSAPLITQDAVLVLLTDKSAEHRAMVSLDPSLRRVNWRRAAPDRWTTTRIFALGKTLFLGTPSGEVTAYCSADGSPAWSHKVSAAAIRSIGGSDETLYVGTPQGTLYAVRPPPSCKEIGGMP